MNRPSKTLPDNPPLVSVLLRTLNRHKLLEEALQSLLEQTLKSFEVVVVNDGGDSVQEVVSKYKDSLDIKLINNLGQLGRAKTANIAARASRGDYLNFLDDDDLLKSNHLHDLICESIKTGHQVVYGNCEYIRYDFENDFFQETERKIFSQNDFNPNLLLLKSYIPIHSVLFHSKLFEKVGGFDESFDIFEDWDFWLRLSKFVHFHKINSVTCCYRNYFKNGTYGHKEGIDYSFWLEKFYKKHLPNLSYELFTHFIVQRAWSSVDHLENEIKLLKKENQNLKNSDNFLGF